MESQLPPELGFFLSSSKSGGIRWQQEGDSQRYKREELSFSRGFQAILQRMGEKLITRKVKGGKGLKKLASAALYSAGELGAR